MSDTGTISDKSESYCDHYRSTGSIATDTFIVNILECNQHGVVDRPNIPCESLWAERQVEIRQVEFFLDAVKRVRVHLAVVYLVDDLTEQFLQTHNKHSSQLGT